MNRDRFFFDPYPLALGKGFAYFLAYATAIGFSGAVGSAYYFNLMLFCCGCVCEYVELGFFREDKIRLIKIISRILSVVIIIFAIVTFSIAYNNVPNNTWVNAINNNQRIIQVMVGILWVIPLGSGFILMLLDTDKKSGAKEKTHKQSAVEKKHALGFRVKP